MNVFLTGGTGFLGNNFIKQLSKKITIYALTRYKENIEYKNVKWIHGNLWDNFDELKSCEIFIHFAAHGVSPSKTTLKKALSVNVDQTLSILNKAVKKGIKKFLIIGTSQEYGDIAEYGSKITINSKLSPKNSYGISKKEAFLKIEKFCKKKRVKITYLRVFNTYGGIKQNKMSLYGQLHNASNNKNDLKIKNGHRMIDILHVAKSINKIIPYLNFEKNKVGQIKVKNIGSGKTISIKEFSKIQWKKLNSKSKLIF
tara:strand:- start:1379 stop:2146 length:768 start_codon:yes stop_codon:yes gene_type:complete